MGEFIPLVRRVSGFDLFYRQGRDTMTQTLVRATEAEPFVIKFRPLTDMTDEQFAEFCALNDVLRIERSAEGEIILMPPTHGTTGNRNADITIDLGNWARGDGTGKYYDSSTGFKLPNGALRSPDASWLLQSRLDTLTSEERSGFISLCPDFVIELRSTSDSLTELRNKMEEYMDNGARLGWLIDPLASPTQVYIYRPQTEIEVLESPDEVSADPELTGFTLNLSRIWNTPL